MRITTVLFDADGVVQSAGRLADHFAQRYGWSPARTVDFFREIFDEQPSGREAVLAGAVDILPAVRDALPRWGITEPAESFVVDWLREGTVPDPAAFDLVAALRRAGVVCGLATNQDPLRARYMERDLGYRELFDHRFYSAELGCAKPDPAFFEAALATLATPAEQVLFIDDHEPNVLAARGCGLHAELHVPGNSLHDLLASYDLAV